MLDPKPTAAASLQSPQALDARAWVISDYPNRIANRVGHLFGFSSDEIADLSQDIIVSALRMGNVQLTLAWFSVTARNRAIDVLRKRMRERFVAEKSKGTSDDELLRLLRARVGTLPTRLSRLYHAWYELRMSQREIANDMGISRARWLHRSLLTSLGCKNEFL